MIRRRALLAYALVAVLMITGCSSGQGHGTRPGIGSAPAGTSAGPAPNGSGQRFPTARSTARPIEPVPSIRPRGVVDPPPGTGLARYTRQKINWTPCGTRGAGAKQCATVRAPLDYDHPDVAAITLAIARRPSEPTQNDGVLFTNPGGPGASGIDFLDYFNAHGLDRSYDIVSWDVRGSGRSTPVRCFTDRQMENYVAADYSPDNAAETQQLINLNTEFGRACLSRSGTLLKHISTEDTVHDLDLLRRLLGQQRLNYFGFSYGTSIGAMYATMFPETVGRMVLDGATSIGGTPNVSQTYGFNRTLGNFAAWCAQQSCRLGGTQQQVQQTIGEFLQRLDQHTIPGGRRELTQSLATSGLLYAMYAPARDWPSVLLGINMAVYADNGSRLMSWADAFYRRDSNGHFSQFNSAFPAIGCLDEGDGGIAGELRNWRRIQKRASTLGPYIGPDLTCTTWPVAATGDTRRKISYSGKPAIVILGTTGDPATPYEYARQMHRALASSRLITLDGDGHLAFDQSSCVQAKVLRYLVDRRTPATSRCS